MGVGAIEEVFYSQPAISGGGTMSATVSTADLGRSARNIRDSLGLRQVDVSDNVEGLTPYYIRGFDQGSGTNPDYLRRYLSYLLFEAIRGDDRAQIKAAAEILAQIATQAERVVTPFGFSSLSGGLDENLNAGSDEDIALGSKPLVLFGGTLSARILEARRVAEGFREGQLYVLSADTNEGLDRDLYEISRSAFLLDDGVLGDITEEREALVQQALLPLIRAWWNVSLRRGGLVILLEAGDPTILERLGLRDVEANVYITSQAQSGWSDYADVVELSYPDGERDQLPVAIRSTQSVENTSPKAGKQWLAAFGFLAVVALGLLVYSSWRDEGSGAEDEGAIHDERTELAKLIYDCEKHEVNEPPQVVSFPAKPAVRGTCTPRHSRRVRRDAALQLIALDRRVGTVPTDLRGANLSGADLSRTDLSNVDFKSANLRGVSLAHAKLTNSILYGADLSEAYLLKTDFSGAVLTHASLKRAKLQKTKLDGADLTIARFCGAQVMDVSTVDTKCPSGKRSSQTDGKCNFAEWTDCTPRKTKDGKSHFGDRALRVSLSTAAFQPGVDPEIAAEILRSDSWKWRSEVLETFRGKYECLRKLVPPVEWDMNSRKGDAALSLAGRVELRTDPRTGRNAYYLRNAEAKLNIPELLPKNYPVSFSYRLPGPEVAPRLLQQAPDSLLFVPHFILTLLQGSKAAPNSHRGFKHHYHFNGAANVNKAAMQNLNYSRYSEFAMSPERPAALASTKPITRFELPLEAVENLVKSVLILTVIARSIATIRHDDQGQFKGISLHSLTRPGCAYNPARELFADNFQYLVDSSWPKPVASLFHRLTAEMLVGSIAMVAECAPSKAGCKKWQDLHMQVHGFEWAGTLRDMFQRAFSASPETCESCLEPVAQLYYLMRDYEEVGRVLQKGAKNVRGKQRSRYLHLLAKYALSNIDSVAKRDVNNPFIAQAKEALRQLAESGQPTLARFEEVRIVNGAGDIDLLRSTLKYRPHHVFMRYLLAIYLDGRPTSEVEARSIYQGLIDDLEAAGEEYIPELHSLSELDFVQYSVPLEFLYERLLDNLLVACDITAAEQLVERALKSDALDMMYLADAAKRVGRAYGVYHFPGSSVHMLGGRLTPRTCAAKVRRFRDAVRRKYSNRSSEWPRTLGE